MIDLARARLAGARSAAGQLAASHSAIARDSRLIARRMEAFDNVLGAIESDLDHASRVLGDAAAQLRATTARCRETVKTVEVIEALMREGDPDLLLVEMAAAKARQAIEGTT